MNTKTPSAFLLASLTFIYISGVAWLMSNIEKFFGSGPDVFWFPVAFLLLFVLSATITGSLVLGKPILLYLDNRKEESLRLFVRIVLWLLVFTFLIFAAISLRELQN